MSGRHIIQLRTIPRPSRGAIVRVPPVIEANLGVDYVCGSCGTVLVLAEQGQIHNLQLRCTHCGAYNLMDD